MARVQTTTEIERWRIDTVRRRSGDHLIASKVKLYRGLILLGTVLSLFRATQMWFGYPVTQEEFRSVDPINMQIFIYILATIDITALILYPVPLIYSLRRIGILLLVSILSIISSVAFSQDLSASLRGIIAVMAITIPTLLYYFEFGGVGMQSLMRHWAMFVIVINIAYTAILPRYGFMAGSLAGTMRGMFLHKNLFGQYMALLFIIFLGSLAGPGLKDRSRLTDSFFMVAALICVILSHSSTALIVLAAGISGLIITRFVNLFVRQGERHLSIVIVISIIALVVVVFGPIIVIYIVGSTGKDFTFSGRTRIWGVLFPHIWDHPLTGHGFAMFRVHEYIESFTSRLPMKADSTHNTYLELLLTIGIPGTVAWVVFVVISLFSKLMAETSSVSLRAAHDQEAVIIMMVMISSFTEAGQMLAPLAIWPVLAGCLPLGRTVMTRPRKPALQSILLH